MRLYVVNEAAVRLYVANEAAVRLYVVLTCPQRVGCL